MGVLLCRAGQSTEEEMYNNEEASPAFSAFLELLGEQVLLKGFTKYAAQLDTKSESSQEPLWLCSDSRIIRFVSQYRSERLDRGAVICKWSYRSCVSRYHQHISMGWFGDDTGFKHLIQAVTRLSNVKTWEILIHYLPFPTITLSSRRA